MTLPARSQRGSSSIRRGTASVCGSLCARSGCQDVGRGDVAGSWVHHVAMAELPTGTVTMLFSDIEGSTLLLSRLGPAYADALDAQRRCCARRGRPMVARRWAPRATASSWCSRPHRMRWPPRPRRSATWPGTRGPVRNRFGCGWGSIPASRPSMTVAYVGMDVHRAARIAGAAHGGQVVVSAATARAGAADCLPDGVGLRDLGIAPAQGHPGTGASVPADHRGLQTDFPPLEDVGCGVEPAGADDAAGGSRWRARGVDGAAADRRGCGW